MKLNENNAIIVLDKYLKDKDYERYKHSIRVANIARILASKWHIPKREAIIAGLLHDIGKGFSKNELLEICSRNNTKLYDFEIFENNTSLHGEVGKIIFSREFSTESHLPEFIRIQSAIQKHVSGAENMSDLDKLIFISDNIEPEKKDHDLFLDIQNNKINDLNECVRILIERKKNRAKLKDREYNPILDLTIDNL